MASGPRPPSDAASATAGATPYSDRVTPSSNGRRIRQQALGVPPADRTRADPSSASRSHRQTPSLVRIASSPHEHVCTMSAQRSPRRYLACDLCRAAGYSAPCHRRTHSRRHMARARRRAALERPLLCMRRWPPPRAMLDRCTAAGQCFVARPAASAVKTAT